MYCINLVCLAPDSRESIIYDFETMLKMKFACTYGYSNTVVFKYAVFKEMKGSPKLF